MSLKEMKNRKATGIDKIITIVKTIFFIYASIEYLYQNKKERESNSPTKTWERPKRPQMLQT